jgi:hypothetical protein
MAYKSYGKKIMEEFDLPLIIGRHLDRTSMTISTVSEFGDSTLAKALTLYSETLEFENLISNNIRDEESKKVIDNLRDAVDLGGAGSPSGFLEFFKSLSAWRKSLIQIATSSGLLKREITDRKTITELEIDGERDLDGTADES